MYYHSYDAYNIQFLSPFLDLTYSPVAPDINHQQDEAAFTLAKECNYKPKASQSVVFENDFFTLCDTP